jgi:hypothetical protein
LFGLNLVIFLMFLMRAFVHGSLPLLSDKGERSSEHWFVLFVYESNVAAQDTLLQDAVVLVSIDSFRKQFVVLDASLLLQHLEHLVMERS